MSTKRLIAARILSAVLISPIVANAPASAQTAATPTRDACAFLQPAGRYCITPAKDAGQAMSQLFSQESNPLVDNPIEFATLYGAVLSQFINTQIGNLSQGSSLAAFSFIRDPTTGALQVKSNTFGPLFSERPQTAGKRAFGFAVTTQRTKFDHLDGTNLSDEGLVNDYGISPGFPPESQRYTSTFSVASQATVFGAVYGATDNLDISVSIPYVRTRVEGVTAYDYTNANRVAEPTYALNVQGTSTGVGDISIRGKYNFRNGPVDQWAVLVDERLPTGNEQRLLGFGKTQTKVALLVSATAGRISPHGTVGYTRAGSGVDLGELKLTGKDFQTFRIAGGSVEPSNEINYAGGVAAEVHPRVTVAGEVIGRKLLNSVRLETIHMSGPVGSPQTPRTLSYFREGSLNLLMGTVGAKVNVGAGWLVIANVLFPLTDAGLKMNLTPVLALQKVFPGR